MDTLAPLPTLTEAEDAAANALAVLLLRRMDHHTEDWRLDQQDAIKVCRDLLRGPLDEVERGQPGGYCMKRPALARMTELARFGALVVENTYTVADPTRALDEALAVLDTYPLLSEVAAAHYARTAAKSGETPGALSEVGAAYQQKPGTCRVYEAAPAGDLRVVCGAE